MKLMSEMKEKNWACPPDFSLWVPLTCQYERHMKLPKNIAIFYVFFVCFFASISIELNEVETSMKKPTSLILCDCLRILLVRRKH